MWHSNYGETDAQAVKGGGRMYPSDLNLTTQIIGYQRFLFVRLPQGGADVELAEALERRMSYVECSTVAIVAEGVHVHAGRGGGSQRI